MMMSFICSDTYSKCHPTTVSVGQVNWVVHCAHSNLNIAEAIYEDYSWLCQYKWSKNVDEKLNHILKNCPFPRGNLASPNNWFPGPIVAQQPSG